MTPDQISANRAAAVAAVRSALGLSGLAPADWTYDQRTTYNKALAAYIASRPEQFSDQDTRNAEAIGKQAYSALEDTSFDTGLFVSEAIKPVADAAKSVGDGVLSVASAAKWALPLGAVVVGVLLLVHFNRKLAAA